MPRPIEFTLTPAAHDADGLADGNDSSGTSLTLDGALTSGGTFTSSDGLGRIITIKDTATSDQSDVNFVVTGTDANGETIAETITGPGSGATVASTEYFYTVSTITISAAQGGAETVDVGTRNATSSAASRLVPLNKYGEDAATVAVDVTGTVNFTVQETFDDVEPNKADDADTPIKWWDVSALATKTADTASTISKHATALRIEFDSYTATGNVRVRILQHDMSK
jgi:hypothetical protein